MAVDLRHTSPLFAYMDDKAKVPIGEPSQPTSTNVRNHPSMALTNQPLTAMDHDQTKCSLTPSVILSCVIPTQTDGSFYSDQADVRLKASVFEPSNPFWHMAELSLSTTLTGNQFPPVAFVYTDGGSDHRVTCKSVQLAYIALFIKDLDLLVASRTCPGHSFSNPAKRVMSTLNLGLQNAAFARCRMTEDSESVIKNANSMSAIHSVANHFPSLKADWAASIETVQKVIEDRFTRLVYEGSQVCVPG